MIVSVMFEFLEYSLEHQLPNFSECWWDHVSVQTQEGACEWGDPVSMESPSAPTRLPPPVDHGRAGVQRTGHLLRHEDTRVALPEDIQVAGSLEHPHLQVRPALPSTGPRGAGG